MLLLENLRAPPETCVQHLVQIRVVALVLSKRIVELVGCLEPRENEEDHEDLREHDYKYQIRLIRKSGMKRPPRLRECWRPHVMLNLLRIQRLKTE